MEQDRQGQNAPGGSPKLDLVEFAKELGVDNPEEAAEQMKGYISADATKEEALNTLAKMNVSSQSLIGKKETKIQDLELKLADLVKGSTKEIKPEVELKPGAKVEPEEEVESKEDKATLEEVKTIRDNIAKELAEIKEIKGQSVRNYRVIDNRLRTEQVKGGFRNMRERLGEERAIELLNPDNPGKSPLGQFLFPGTIKDNPSLHQWANERSSLAWDADDPVIAAMRFVPGCEKDLEKMVSYTPPNSETSGRATFGQAGSVKEDKLKEIAKEIGREDLL